jgi:DNA-binding transcriptional LysR family regulator
MHWDDFRFFLAVARTGQLAKAGARLGVDATTVGRRIRRLEAALEQVLFEQTREGQTLTEAGERLLLQVEQIERSASAIETAPENEPKVSGLVRVSASEGFGTWFVAHRLRSFSERYPGVQVDLVANSGFLSPTRRETDVAILLDRPHKGPLITRKLADYSLRLYASRAYLERHGPVTDRGSLGEHPLIGYIPDFIYTPQLRYLDEIMPGLALRLRSSSINAQYRLAASGAGIAVLPSFIGDADRELVNVVPDARIMRSFWLVTHEDTRRLARIEAFVEWLMQEVDARRDLLIGTD